MQQSIGTQRRKRIFITGASSGIGAALVRRYAQQGTIIGLVARRRDVLDALVATLPNPQLHRVFALDVTDSAALAQAAQLFLADGGVDIVIASAGVSAGTLTEHEKDLPIFQRIIDTNLIATVATFAPFIATMKSQTSPVRRQMRLVGIASVAGMRGLPGAGAYSASKAAVICYCESLRVELIDSGIQVVTLVPGYIATPMTEKNAYRMPFLMPVEKFAVRAVACIEAGQRYRVIPWQMGIIARCLKWLPDVVYDFIFRRAPHKARSSESS